MKTGVIAEIQKLAITYAYYPLQKLPGEVGALW